jgi:hypothetical protein
MVKDNGKRQGQTCEQQFRTATNDNGEEMADNGDVDDD